MSESGNNDRQSSQSLLNELLTYCSSDLLSEEGLRVLFERHGLTPNNDIGNFNYEFFYRAYRNERVNEGIIRCLIEYFPDAARATDERGCTPLHYACNKSMTRGLIELLIDAAPDSVRSVTNFGAMPLHSLCANKRMNETASMQLLKLLIEKCPAAARHADSSGSLPIHYAAVYRCPEFCSLLIEAHPGSERIADSAGWLPLHFACENNHVGKVEYLYNLYPDAINHADTKGYYPIHYAIMGMRGNPETAIDTVQYLLDCDPNVKFHKRRGKSLFHYACKWNYNDSNIDAAFEIVKAIYDAHPEAIEDNRIASNIHRYHKQVQAFINIELVYARQAKDHRLMMTPDGNGQLPLHKALQGNVRLGSIKLLVEGNPSAIRSVDDSGAFPLHIACQHHESTSVVKYLVSLADITLDAIDRQGNTALHYACRGARHGTIAMLLETYDAVSVSKCAKEASHRPSFGERCSGREGERRIYRKCLQAPEGLSRDDYEVKCNTSSTTSQDRWLFVLESIEEEEELGAV